MHKPTMISGTTKGILAATLSGAFGGLAIVATRLTVAEADLFTVATLRYLGAALILLLFVRSPGRLAIGWRDTLQVAGLGLLYFCAHPLLFTAALARVSAGEGALIITLSPLFAMALGVMLGHERVSARRICGIMIASAGVALPFLVGNTAVRPAGAWLGDVMMLSAAAITGLYSNLARPLLARHGALPVTTLGMCCGSAALTAVALIAGKSLPVGLPIEFWALVAYLAGPGCALTFFLLIFAMGRVPPASATVFITLNPVVAPIAASVAGEPLDPVVLLGAGVVLAGIVLTNLAPARAGLRRP